MEEQAAGSRSGKNAVTTFLLTAALAVGAPFVNPLDFIDQDWSAEKTATILGLLPFYFAACLAVAAFLVAAALRRFPRQLPMITIAATILVLSGGIVLLKVYRDEQAGQARIVEAERLADEILTLRRMTPIEMEPAARGIMRRIVVDMYGEEMAGDIYLKPASVRRKEAGL